MRFNFSIRLPIVILIPGLLFFACADTKEKQSSFDDLDTYLLEKLPADEPGGAVLIMKNDSVIFSKGYGVADIHTKEKITPQTLFNIGSITKTFVSNAILILRDQGKLSLEDSLLKYFPEFKNKTLAEKIKIKHLLTHTSGLP